MRTARRRPLSALLRALPELAPLGRGAAHVKRPGLVERAPHRSRALAGVGGPNAGRDRQPVPRRGAIGLPAVLQRGRGLPQGLHVHRAALRERGRGRLAGGAVSQARAADPVALARRSVSQPRCGRDQGLPRRRRLRGPPERDLPGRHGRDRLGDPALASADGFAWTQVRPEPIIRPEGRGWKRAFVYQLDVARSGRELRLYYNARSGWFLGAERIGVAIAST